MKTLYEHCTVVYSTPEGVFSIDRRLPIPVTRQCPKDSLLFESDNVLWCFVLKHTRQFAFRDEIPF